MVIHLFSIAGEIYLWLLPLGRPFLGTHLKLHGVKLRKVECGYCDALCWASRLFVWVQVCAGVLCSGQGQWFEIIPRWYAARSEFSSMHLMTVLFVVAALSRGRSLVEREQQTQPQNSLVAVFHVVESTWSNLYLKSTGMICKGWYGCKTPFLHSYVFPLDKEKHFNPSLPWSSAAVSQCLQPSQAAPAALQPGAAVSWVSHGLAELGAERALLCDGLHQARLQTQNLKCKCLLVVSYQPSKTPQYWEYSWIQDVKRIGI